MADKGFKIVSIIGVLIVLIIGYTLMPIIVNDLGNETKFDSDGNLTNGNQFDTGANLFLIIIPIVVVMGLLLMILRVVGLKKGKKR